MSLTTGRAPLSDNPAGRFDKDVPAGTVYTEPHLRRVRAVRGGHTVLDSERVLLVHRPGRPPEYAFPAEDAAALPSQPEPAAPGYVQVPWDAVDDWYEEEERVFGHPRNPYHRIDCLRGRRRLRVEAHGTELVNTDEVVVVYETSRLPQLYVRRAAVRTDLLVRSATVTYCPYKGSASHWTLVIGDTVVPDVAWSYDTPTPESIPIAGLLSFYSERVQMTQDVPTWFTPPAPPTGETPPRRENDLHRENNQGGSHG